jgi:hypothetical protein
MVAELTMSGHAFVAYFLCLLFLIGLIYHDEFRKDQYFVTSGAKYFLFTMCLLVILSAAGLVVEVWSLW